MAIAFVNAADLGNNGGTTNNLTAAYTVGSGSNRALVIASVDFDVANFVTPTVQYNGVSAALQVTDQPQTALLHLLLNPASGMHNVTFTTANTPIYIQVMVSEYTGVKQTGQPDGATHTDDPLIEDTYSSNFSTVADNCWVIGYAINSGGGAISGAAPFNTRVTEAQYSNGLIADTAVHPAGSVTFQATITNGGFNQGHLFLSLLPDIQALESKKKTFTVRKRRILKVSRRRLLPQPIIQPAHAIPWRPRRVLWLRRRRGIPAQRLLKQRQAYPIPKPVVAPRFNQGIAFRQTLGFVSDVTFFDFGQFSATANYPAITRQSNTVGFTVSAPTVTGQNQIATQDHRLAGNLFNNI